VKPSIWKIEKPQGWQVSHWASEAAIFIHRPRKVDSRKNAASPSIASGAPKTLPTNFE
jgi:hypothetical protein